MVATNQERRADDPRIENIEKEIAEICAELEKINDKLQDLNIMREKLEADHEQLYGNGKPGLIIQMDRVVQGVEEMKKIGYYIIASLISVGVVFLVNAIIHAASAP